MNEDQQNLEDEANLQTDDGWLAPRDQQSADLTKFMLTPDEPLGIIEHELKGEIWLDDQQKWHKIGDPFLNDAGIRAIMSKLKFYSNKITFLTDLDNEYIYEMMLCLANDLTQLLFNNGEDYGIDWSKSHQNDIVNDITSIIFASTRKSYLQTFLKFLQTSTRTLHRVDESTGQKEKKGLFGFGGK